MSFTFYLFLIAIALGLAAWFVFLWAIRTGQFKDVEGIKYRMLDRDKEE